MVATLDQAQIDSLRWNAGVGDGTTTACVNSLAYLLDAQRRGVDRETAMRDFTDNASCICPVACRLSIRINDWRAAWASEDEANAWMHATAPLLLDSRGSLELTNRRGFLCADAAVREIAPAVFDIAAERWSAAKEWAEKLRAVAPVIDTRTARAARDVAQQARRDAYAAAAAAADAVAYAYAYAAADAAADAVAYAYAAAAADAVAYAAAAAVAYAYAAAAAVADADADAYAAAVAYAYAAAARIRATTFPMLHALLSRVLAEQEAQP